MPPPRGVSSTATLSADGTLSASSAWAGAIVTYRIAFPTVSSINRVNSNPNYSSSVSWTVTFSEAVTGVDTADFALAVSGLSGSSITSVFGNATTWTVTANTGTGAGTLGLNLADNDTIKDSHQIPLGGTAVSGGFTGQVYNIGAAASIGTGVGNETSGTNIVFTLNTAVVVGNTVLVTVAMDPNAGAVTVADNAAGGSNTYTNDADVTNGSGTAGVRTLVFSAPVTNALVSGNTITVTFGTATVAKAVRAYQTAGLLTAAKDQSATATGTGMTPSAGPTAATAQPDELVFGIFGAENNVTLTAGSGYAALGSQSSDGGTGTTNVTTALEGKVVAATGTQTAAGTISTSALWAAAVVTYKIAVPTVSSITRDQSSPTSTLSVSWTGLAPTRAHD